MDFASWRRFSERTSDSISQEVFRTTRGRLRSGRGREFPRNGRFGFAAASSSCLIAGRMLPACVCLGQQRLFPLLLKCFLVACGEEEDEAARAFGRNPVPDANSDDCGDPEVPDFDKDCDF